MAVWLTPEAAALLCENGAVAADGAWVGAVDAACAWVERKRPDLNVPQPDPDPPVYTPDAAVKLGTAMLANRWYARRASPLGVAGYSEFGTSELLRHDPDIAKLLGLGADGPFRFGAGVRLPEEEAAP